MNLRRSKHLRLTQITFLHEAARLRVAIHVTVCVVRVCTRAMTLATNLALFLRMGKSGGAVDRQGVDEAGDEGGPHAASIEGT